MQIDEGLDTGPVYDCREVAIEADETAPELSERLSLIGAQLLVDTLSSIEKGEALLTPQSDREATIAPRLRRSDGYVRWEEPAVNICNKIRAFLPWPAVVVSFRGVRCRLLRARPLERKTVSGRPGEVNVSGGRLAVTCGDGQGLEILELQMENRKAATGADFVNGFHVGDGECFVSLAGVPETERP